MNKSILNHATCLAVLLSVTPRAFAGGSDWHAQSLPEALAYMALFAFVGVMLAIAGYKLFDKCTPGDLHREIIENKNVAAAIIGAAVIIGVCIVVAASMS